MRKPTTIYIEEELIPIIESDDTLLSKWEKSMNRKIKFSERINRILIDKYGNKKVNNNDVRKI